ncbi:hypothetical protein HN51_006764 [Arachis hypogaea]
MANTTSTFHLASCLVIILLLLLRHQHVCVEARVFKSRFTNSELAGGDHGSARGNDARRHHRHESKRREGYEVDTFRPTSPGHSPGVGHSITN